MKKILILILAVIPMIASAQSTLTPQEQLEQAQKQLEEAQKALEVARANASRAAEEAKAKAREEAEAKAKAEAEAKAAAEAKAKADAEAKEKAAQIQKKIQDLKRQTEELEQQAAILDGKVVESSSVDKTQSYEQHSSKDKKEVGTVGNTKIKTRLSPVDGDDADENEEKYLVTDAVPVVDGKVEWTTTINVPGRDAGYLYSVSKDYLSQLVSDKLQLPGSRVVVKDSVHHSVAAFVHEWLVFRNTALSLDRSEIFYLLEISCSDGKATATMSRVKYKYATQGKPETYLAEKWITDKEAVNKKHTRLYPISGKFRRKTIDRKDEIFETLREALQ
ncbi:MAG: DUF4468 domain-containing protein [Prevotella sp.]|nr:DUF4468 domain-containing protein [Prevotella sp.]